MEENIFVLIQLSTYILAFILSFFIFVPIGIHHDKFGGRCALNTGGYWITGNSSGTERNISNFTSSLSDVSTSPSSRIPHFVFNWGSTNNCHYGIFIGHIIMILALVQILRTCLQLYADRERPMDLKRQGPLLFSSLQAALIDCVGSIILTIMLFVSAVIITFGYNKWCSAITHGPYGFSSCELAGIEGILFKDELSGVNISGFYTELSLAEFGVWSTWIILIIISFMSTTNLCRLRKMEKDDMITMVPAD